MRDLQDWKSEFTWTISSSPLKDTGKWKDLKKINVLGIPEDDFTTEP